MTHADLEKALAKYLPLPSVEPVARLVIDHHVHLRVTKSRRSKLGDYRHPYGNKGHRITINHDLNPYSFLVTLLHEIAHLANWNRHQNNVDPHGREWKHEFRQLLIPFVRLGVFPPDLDMAIKSYLQNPGASSCADPNLYKALQRYNKNEEEDLHFVDDLPVEAVFTLDNGMVFRKGLKRRTRYRCRELRTNKFYDVSGAAKVKWIRKESGERERRA